MVKVELDKEKGRFYMGEVDENYLSFFRDNQGALVVTYTYISPENRGKGYGKVLVQKAVDLARDENLKIIPSCSYVRALMGRNEDWRKWIK